MADQYTLRLPALQVRQGHRRIYTFAVDGKKLPAFASIPRLRREDDGELQGYQRPEVLGHIAGIRRYVESDGAMLLNALVVALDHRVTFVPALLHGELVDYSVVGELVIPVDETLADQDKPVRVVDGQQRLAAIRDASLAEFPVAITGFFADTEEQRSQFILLNSTEDLPKALVHELLPETSGHLPKAYRRRRLPAQLVARLNTDRRSPFYRLIATPTTQTGYIADGSVLGMIEHSLFDGALYQYRDGDGSGDVDRMVDHLVEFWTVVRDTWPDEWSMRPTRSRLTHSVGIQALGLVMDAIDPPTFRGVIESLKPDTAWTSGSWVFADGSQCEWNAPSLSSRLGSHLLWLVNGRS
ncbi:DGQHR domain-containing protein DpdB [Actinokineospora globicatena]|uniref:DGQHR domain-containing protein n=1 Tax=Actinokineospora globicatena TaxID=103729 RepID=A0A9W6V863_9PSEU|nr:DGQHR domain-containing protein DpdB [Actinokineospora globicatena]GLW90634.1 hypothetical protein Aglo03_14500 [Actinokineospora globicatena]